MQYDDDSFLALLIRIEEQGGRLLDDVHATRAENVDVLKGYEQTGRSMKMNIKGCGEQVLFEIPYRDSRSERAGKLVACAVCDDLGKWNRFN